MVKEELQAGNYALLAEDKKSSIIRGKLLAKKGDKVKIISTNHFPVILIENTHGLFSINANKLIKIQPQTKKQ